MGVPRYQGRFGAKEAERLLWRAGFGPRPGEAQKLARKGLRGAVFSLTRPKKKPRLIGPAPHDDRGLPLAPADAWGHDHLWWLDRMVRSNQPLIERMTLLWHDWFATADIGKASLNLAQNELFRRGGLGSFEQLLLEVTRDPAMLVWLSGTENSKWAPNENYARELMELFTLGAGAGYSEQDVREQARALTGWTNDWDDNVGYTNFRFDPGRHDSGVKRIFGRSGNFDWQGSCRLCLEHPAHEPFLVNRLWSYFIPTPPSPKTARALRKMYRGSGRAIRPLVEAILMHPDLHRGPPMVKPPVVQIAGMLRARKAPVRDESWIWISDVAGQRLFDPPNVAGWDEGHWLDTARLSGRWRAAANLTAAAEAADKGYDPRESAGKAVARALAFWGRPRISKATRAELLRFARDVEARATEEWQQSSYRALRQNALRIMVATSPDLQTA